MGGLPVRGFGGFVVSVRFPFRSWLLELVKAEQIETEVDAWEAFWLLYPRHEAKKDARKAWSKIDPARHGEILASLVEWRKVLLDRELNFRPLPASWLRGERWED